MHFSVIIPSRNRPELLLKAIESVLSQTDENFEIIVVNDGSDGEAARKYKKMAGQYPENVRFIELTRSPQGHGPSYAINRGVESAQGKYICFLDDDDFWTRPDHLERAWKNLSLADGDAYFTQQNAYQSDELVRESLWLNELPRYIEKKYGALFTDCREISLGDLMQGCPGKFAHLNTFVIRRSLYLSIGGMDENIRYECEWDLYLRVIAAADTMLYRPTVISHHNVPDPALQANVSTGMPFLRKLLFRSIVLDKALMFSPKFSIREMARRQKIYTLKRIAESLEHSRQHRQALFYAREAKIEFWELKWRLYTLYLATRALLACVNQEKS